MAQFQKLNPTQDELDLINWFSEYIDQNYKIGKVTKYETLRIAIKFLRALGNAKGELAKEKVKEFLAGAKTNANQYRNTYYAVEKLLVFMNGYYELMKDIEKPKKPLPKFSLSSVCMDDLRLFASHMENEKLKIHFMFMAVSAIRPEHSLRLTKKLIDTNTRFISSWTREYSNKNFFFSFMTPQVSELMKPYLATLKENDKVFSFGMRYLQKYYREISEKCGVKITPKSLRKFTTNYLERNKDYRMLRQDVDLLTSHTPKNIIDSNYTDNTPEKVKEEYDRATVNLKF